MSVIRKCLAVGIILLFVGACIIPAIAQDVEKSLPASDGKWLYVGGSGPGNYTKIQDAINDSHDGDMVFVFDDSSPYYERVKINKSIHLIGENRETTVIDSQAYLFAVYLAADDITFTGFTVRNATLLVGYGMFVESNNNTIKANMFTHNSDSDIYLMNSNNNTIIDNTFVQSMYGIWLSESNDTTINRNSITHNGYGIVLENSKRTIISKNNIMDNRHRDAFFAGDRGLFPLSNHWDANYWGRHYFFPKKIPGRLILLEKHPLITFPLVTFDWHPAQEPYDIPGNELKRELMKL